MTEPLAGDELERPSQGPSRGFEAFAHRDFTLFWIYRFISTAAIEMLITTVGWQVYRLTGSELDLGFIGLAQFAPFAILFPFTGLVADRFPRGRILMFCSALEIACAATFVFMFVVGDTRFSVIMIVLVIFGVARAFQSAVQHSIVPVLVPDKDFGNAIAWLSSSSKISRVVGPVIAGFMIAAGEMSGTQELPVYVTIVCMFVATLACTLMIRTTRQVLSTERVSFASLSAGLKFIWTRQVICAAVVLDLFAVLFGGAMALLPVYATTILDVGPEGLGFMRSAYMGGAFAGGIALTRWPIRQSAGVKLLTSTLIFGSAATIFGLSTIFWISLCALALMGTADMVSVFVRHNLVQLITPDDMRGRVGAATGMFIGASNELGELESGVTAHWWGTVPAVVIGGLATIGVSLLVTSLSPVLRRVNGLEAGRLIDDYQAPHDRYGRPTQNI